MKDKKNVQKKKKEQELQLLKKIYNENNKNLYQLVNESSEKPDFILKDLKSNEIFGVEITKMYYNESSARLKEIPNYVTKLLKDGIPRKDQGILAPHQLYVLMNNKWEYIGDTIGQSFKNYDDYIDTLVKKIVDKTEKAKNYQKLDYLELFIDDRENYLYWKKIEDLEYMQKSEKLQEAVNSSPFRRIYFFTIINQQESLEIIGDNHSGPLFDSEEFLEKHLQYMENIFKNNRKDF